MTPVWIAVFKGHEAALRLLLAAGANPNTCHADGWTPVSIAAYHGREAALRVLLEHGVDADKKDDDGLSPLDCAKQNNHAGCVALLEARPSALCVHVNGW